MNGDGTDDDMTPEEVDAAKKAVAAWERCRAEGGAIPPELDTAFVRLKAALAEVLPN